MHVGEICTRSAVTCRPETAVPELARLMRDHQVGDVIIVDERDGATVPVGIVTDRDLVLHVLAAEADPAFVRAADLCGRRFVTACDSEAIYDAIWHMRSQGVRRLPVVDARNRLLGVVTADDLTRCLAEELMEVARIPDRQIQHEQAAAREAAAP